MNATILQNCSFHPDITNRLNGLRAFRPLSDLLCDGEEAVHPMARTQRDEAPQYPEGVLKLPDVDQAKLYILL